KELSKEHDETSTLEPFEQNDLQLTEALNVMSDLIFLSETSISPEEITMAAEAG
ncbi:MAG: hypothetical protein JSS09_00375, partial [Verrucomicrobia bacterium]|nr:hypothetical protein [Verrucomicrobiota bacterium]